MHRGLQAEIRRIVLITLLLLFIGFMLGEILLTLLAGGSIYMLWTFSHIARLYDWLDQGASGLPPDASGVWGDMTDYLYRMQQRNDRAKQSRRQLSERVRNITSALPDGIMTLTPDRVLEWWNPAAETLLGLEKGDRGQSIINIVRDPRFVAFIQHHDLPPPTELPSPEDPSRTLLYSAAEFGDGNIILMVQDITRLRNLEQMRQDFVANISHELRTPLTVLSGYLETLQDNSDQLPGNWKKALDQMDQQTERLNALANDLVMLSQLESNRKPPPRTSVDVATLLQQVAQDASMVCSENHQVTTDIQEESLEVRGEYKELYSAFSNLAINAIKHNPGGVDVSLVCHSTENEVIIEICDNGYGIDPKHIPRLTERFYRVDNSRASSTGGTGLGLAIVKHVLMRHGGTLKIRSTLGKGSCFCCHLPKPAVVA
ncbi:MAG: phosphate regulon sensor histidine kinase PhoR [Gammaproteobacteria bacterium]|nr:MAG: phosphate regulon sensor histidine kinase PhoR [Gammaproteobacteria bacterium]